MSKGTEGFKTVLESFLHTYFIDRDRKKASTFLSNNFKRTGMEQSDNSECEKNFGTNFVGKPQKQHLCRADKNTSYASDNLF